MGRRSVRAQWRDRVIQSKRIDNATRVLLLVMYDDMNERGYVSVPRSRLAERLQVHPSRITERIKRAKEARLLDSIVVGRPGMTAVYAAVLGG